MELAVIDTSVQPVTIPPAASSRPKVNRISPLSSTSASTSSGNT